MRILLTNDDGYQAIGIKVLYEALIKIADVLMIAPERENSAVGHAITVFEPIKVLELKEDDRIYGYAVNGTPADCVKLGLVAIYKKKPDLVVSGINAGPNTGTNIIYSGTVSAATEGTIFGIPSIAISIGTRNSLELKFATEFTAKLANIIHKQKLPVGTLLNVNVPALPKEQIKGIKITRQGASKFKEIFLKRIDPLGRTYYWLDGETAYTDKEEDADAVALKNGFVSITPITYDLTNYRYRDEIKYLEGISLE
ncbi:MAG: 5'/3'-nucleotidase SurE [Actinobacteria bacterium]|nr:5'/3'-nucleotidase SurE [Actinomycetota bacterium]